MTHSSKNMSITKEAQNYSSMSLPQDYVSESEKDESLLGSSLLNENVGECIVNETVFDNSQEIDAAAKIDEKKSKIVTFLNNRDISNDGLGDITSILVHKSKKYLKQNSWSQEEFQFHVENESLIENNSTPNSSSKSFI